MHMNTRIRLDHEKSFAKPQEYVFNSYSNTWLWCSKRNKQRDLNYNNSETCVNVYEDVGPIHSKLYGISHILHVPYDLIAGSLRYTPSIPYCTFDCSQMFPL